MLLPMAEPVEAIGASRPTLPPKATVSVEAISEVYMFLAGSLERLRLMASSTPGRPWPISPLTIYFTKSTVSRMPTRGRKKMMMNEECWVMTEEPVDKRVTKAPA